MIKAEYDLMLDIRQDAPTQTSIVLTQNDNGTNILNVRVFDGSAEVNYTQIDHAWIVFVKLDGKPVQENLIARESPNKGYYYPVGSTELEVPGTVIAAVLLFGTNNERISTSRFTFTAQPDLITGGAVASSSQFDALTALITDIKARIAAGEFTGHAGPQGKGFQPKGTYTTLLALQSAHPTGVLGEQYIVGDGQPATTFLYIWSVDSAAWESAGLVAQKGDKGDKGDLGAPGTNGTKGADGTNGTNGADGATPTINATTKHWEINGTDTGVAADTVIVSDTSSTTKSQLVADNTEYRFGALTSLTLTFPTLTATSYFDANIAFTSGPTATTFSGTGPKYKGEEVVSGAFTPAANKRYNLAIWYDGVNTNVAVSGVA